MANSNVNIANKLYAYIAHGCDITTDITEVYKNSMIFIGDERQIYVPVMNAYVGIGMTAYNSTLNKIASLEDQFNQLAKNVSTGNISKIYANYSTDEFTNSGIIPSTQIENISDDNWALTNDITIKGIGDYNPDTHYARRNNAGEQYELKDANNTSIYITGNGTLTTKPYQNGQQGISSYTNATSGITVTPHWGSTELVKNEVTREYYEKRVGNYITIDDSLTWSYMTSAYSYSLAFSQNYADTEINRLYHNLIGDETGTYVPVSCSSIIHDVTSELSNYEMPDGVPAFITQYNTDHPDTILVQRSSDNHFFLIEKNNNLYIATYTGDPLTGNKTYEKVYAYQIAYHLDGNEQTESGITSLNYIVDNSTDVIESNFWQLYVYDNQYNSSYNMNIKDGIQTLKEVAYLLDILSDGSLGKVSYMTYAEYTANNGASNPATYHVIVPTNNNPKNTDIYAYWVNTGNPDNLGIQIAYSIAGNQIQISDLHKHAELLEKGETTLRSIQSTNTNFANLVLEGGSKQWADTDTNQGASSFGSKGSTPPSTHPNASVQSNITNYQPSYLIGDVNLKIDLQTSTVYTTTYNVAGKNHYYKDESGVVWYGCYTAADMHSLDTANATYYTRGGNYAENSSDFTFTPRLASEIELDPAKQTTQYYWQPGFVDSDNNGMNDNYSSTVNQIITSITVKDLIALEDTESIKGTEYSKAGTKPVQAFGKLDENGNFDGSGMYNAGGNYATAFECLMATGVGNNNVTLNDRVGFISGYSNVKLHAKTDENKLATTQWTEVYVGEKLENINARLADISDIAASSVDQLIGKLDSEYKYSDFATYWTTYLSSNNISTIPGSPEYETAYNREYRLFVNRATDNWEVYWENYAVLNNIPIDYYPSSAYTSAQDEFENRPIETTISSGGAYRLSYITNSEYVYNTVQKDGTVTAESRELPTDILRVKTDIWGEQNSSNKFEYEDITGLTNDSDSLLNALYAWKDANDDNQIFVKLQDATYIPITGTFNVNDNYYFLTENGDFENTVTHAVDGLRSKIKDAWNSGNTNDKYWRQLYELGPKYLELDLQNAANIDGLTLAQRKKTVKIVQDGTTFTLTKQNSGKITVSATGGSITIDTDNVLKHIKTKPQNSKEYLSVENKHFSYVDNGNGENQFEVTAHITKLEDATPDNTGFADAYDVRSFIENMFKWVNISASVTTNSLQRDAFYKNTSYEMYITYTTPPTLYNRTENGTEPNITVIFSTVSGSNINYGWYWSDTNKFVTNAGASENINPETGLPTSATINKEGHNLINGSYVTKRFKSQDISAGTLFTNAYNYYICLEKEYTNPLNLKETDYGKPTPVQP